MVLFAPALHGRLFPMLLFAFTASRFFPMRLCHGGPANQGRRCWVANDAASCPWHSSCKSPRTLQKCKSLITRQLTLGAVRGGLDLCSPSTRLKVNHLCIRYLCFESVRGDLQEGHFYASRCHLSLCSSTKRFFVKFSAVKLSKFGRF